MTDAASPRHVTVRLYTHVEKDQWVVRAALAGETHIARGGRLLLELLRADTGNIEGQWVGPQKPLMRRALPRLLPGAVATATFPIAKLPQGDWCVRATFRDRLGRRCETRTVQDRLLARPDWLGSDEAVSRRVPAPWTPLRVRSAPNGVRVRCWGRDHLFTPDAFLSQVHSLERPLLDGPVALTARVDGRPVRWRGGTLRRLASDPDQAVLVREASAGPLAFRCDVEADFDGMLRFDWRITSSAPVRVDALTMEIPVRADVARYFYQYRGRCGDDRWMGRIPRGGLAKGFRPCVWLGDERAGLAWFAESDENWFHGDPDRCIELRRRGGAWVLRLNLVSTPVLLTPTPPMFPFTDRRPPPVGSLRYTFVLQATPVKPIARDAWDRRIVCLQQHTEGQEGTLRLDTALLDRLQSAGVRTVVVFEHWSDVEAHKLPRDPALLRRIVRACHARGMQTLFYFGFLLADLAPEYDAFGPRCFALPKTGWPMLRYDPQPPQAAWRVCLRSAWQDLVASGAAYVMDALGADGVYLDGTAAPYACRNLSHGCGTLRKDGSIGPTFPIFSVRSTMRRIHEAVTSRKPEGQVDVHNSTCMTTPTIGFATTTWDGEQFAGIESGTPADRFLSLDVFRTEFMGRQWGVAAELLCYGKPLTYRQAWALALLHDVPVRPMLTKGCNDLELASRLWRVMEAFDRKGAAWHPYWEKERVAATSKQGIYVSAYVHPKRRALLVVSNLGAQPADAAIRLDLARLGLREGAITARDALTGDSCALRRGGLRVAVAPRDFTLIRLERAAT